MMADALITTCAGFSTQIMGAEGRCPKRGDCRRYLHHVPGRGYPQGAFLCSAFTRKPEGEWEMYSQSDFARSESDE
jgi:hypothetical protein